MFWNLNKIHLKWLDKIIHKKLNTYKCLSSHMGLFCTTTHFQSLFPQLSIVIHLFNYYFFMNTANPHSPVCSCLFHHE
jgi:hypothetical protein